MNNCLKCEMEHDGSYGSGKFCSQKCCRSYATAASRKSRNSKISASLSSKTYTCKDCGENFTGEKAHLRYRQHIKRTFQKLKREGSRKKWLLKERGHCCEMCKNTTWLGKPIPLQLDHIDGNSDNNEKDNLRIICPNCHSMTPTFAGKNIGKVSNSNSRRLYRTINVIRIVPANNRASKT